MVNQWDEVCTESLTLTKSLFFVSKMLKDIQDSLKAVGHPPTAFLYTDSPQHMLIASSFYLNHSNLPQLNKVSMKR